MLPKLPKPTVEQLQEYIHELQQNIPSRTALDFWVDVSKPEINSLIDALKENKTLTTLELSNLDSKTVQRLAGVLTENTTLHTLCLDYNEMQDEDMQCLLNALSKNKTLSSLNLSGKTD